MGIKAVIFDYGQVISLPQDPKTIDRLAERIGVEREKFEPVLWSLRGEYDRGTFSSREYYREILARFGITMNDASIDELVEIDLSSWKNINDETVALMKDIKSAGYILGILSNMSHEFLAWTRENVSVLSILDVGLFSCEVNLIKPEEAIFRKLLFMLDGIKSEELVFFDDIAENIKSARDLGIESFLWKDSETARRQLESLGVCCYQR
jgi:putative hydrolase of the HAD superfamily